MERPLSALEPPPDCPLCPRLVALRHACQAEHPDWFNAPVPAFGDPDARIAIIGLAPGKHGANRTGRVFTGDFAGDLLFDTLARHGLLEGRYDARVDDGVRLRDIIVVNSVKCLPPQNKPTPQEVATCRRFLAAQVEALSRVRVFIALGRIAHGSALSLFGMRAAAAPFGHLAEHVLPDGRALIDSYHCSRYNTQTGRLTAEMFSTVFARAIKQARV